MTPALLQAEITTSQKLPCPEIKVEHYSVEWSVKEDHGHLQYCANARDRGCFKTCYCTVKVADPVVPWEFAPMIAVPADWQFATPATLGALAMVATGPDDELQ